MSQMQIWETYRSLTRDSSVKKRGIRNGTVNRVLEYAAPLKKDILLLIVIVVIDAFLVVAQPLLFKRIIDDGITAGNKNIVITTAIYVGVLAILSAGLSIIGRLYSSRIGEGLILTLRTQVFNHVQAQPIAFFTRTQTGSLISRVNGDVIGAQQAFTSTLSGIISNGISLIIVLSTMIILSWQITLTSLILLPVFLIPAKWMGKRVQSLSREQMTLNAEMSQTMTERFNVSGALLVKLFGDPIVEGSSFFKKASRVKDIGVRIAMTNMVFFVALTTVATIATAIVYGFGGSLVISGVLTLGTLLALTALLARLYGPLTSLSNVRVDIMTALVSFERVFEVLDLQPLVKDSLTPQKFVEGPLDIEFKNVSFHYPSRADVGLESLELASDGKLENDTKNTVLNNISFKVASGTMLALVGPSGSGKTTISQLIARLYDPIEGQVTVGNSDIKNVLRIDIKKDIGVVTQDSHLFHDTIKNNLLYAKKDASEEDIWSALTSAQIADFVKSLPDKLDTVVGDRGYRLSGGEKQRIAIARVFLKQPRVVILDEATAHLDNENEAAVQVALATVLQGRTSVVIAHRLSTIINAEQIAVIKEGKLIAIGNHNELLKTNEVYSDLYNQQFAV
ncbi:MAG: ABC transporter ATP-binding protein [Candidatus Nanopelagicales bacterium]|jgi:ATP-binding cassette subfamily B protein|nr:ABC transporter ATP-binding protein [Candidatus Nanopelagicales bacterium]MBJ7393314.1 ABC transporter ATP-binding protein [Candidatus Nanopelagicales bacterium]